ncbi:MAG: hypothetical protein GWP08_04760 [Nitrospiraceae bacterium]|nr:hypothetical protein [Nitrospiraceae bacterium]
MEVLSDPKLLKSVRGVVRGFAESHALSDEKAMEVVLAVDEACTNAMRHAYGSNPGRKLWLSLRSTEDGIEIVLRDDGTPASSERVKQKEVVAPDLETLKPGGLGVQILYEVFDEVDFVPGPGSGNCITMRLRRPDGA